MNIRLNKNHGTSVINNTEQVNINLNRRKQNMNKVQVKNSDSSINETRIEGYNPVLKKFLIQEEDNKMQGSTFMKSIFFIFMILITCMGLFYYTKKGVSDMNESIIRISSYGVSLMNMISFYIGELMNRYTGYDWELFLGKVSMDFNDAMTLLSCELKSLFYITLDMAKICSQPFEMMKEFIYAQSKDWSSFFNFSLQGYNFSWLYSLSLISFVFNLMMFLIFISRKGKENSKFVNFVPVPEYNSTYLYSLKHNNPNKGGLTMGNLYSKNHNAKQQNARFVNGYSGNQEPKKDNKNSSSHFSKGILYIVIGGSILFACSIVFTCIIVNGFFVPKPTPIEVPRLELPAPQVALPQVQKPKLDAKKIMEEHVNPVLEVFHYKNRELLNNCIETLEDKLKMSYQGIDPFLDDITSLRTKIGLGWNWVKGNKEEYVNQKFEKYILSEKKLNEIINEVVEQYFKGLEGNINQLNVDIKTGIEVSIKEVVDKSEIPVNMEEINKDVDKFVKEAFASSISQLNNDIYKLMAGTLVANLVPEIAFSIGGRIAASSAVAGLSRVVPSVSSMILVPAMKTVGVNIASSTALSALMTGGGTVGGASTGASIGSIIPGLGTIVGFIVGTGIGCVIENHFDNKFKENVKPQIEGLLDNIQKQVSRSFSDYFKDFETQAFSQNLKNCIYAKVNKFCDEQNEKW